MTHFPSLLHTSSIQTGQREVHRRLTAPADSLGVVLLAPGTTPHRHLLAEALAAHRIALATVDVTPVDERALEATLIDAIAWIHADEAMAGRPLALFAADRAVEAALATAARRPSDVAALVAVSGVLDSAAPTLVGVPTPALFLVASADDPGLAAHRALVDRLCSTATIVTIAGSARDLLAGAAQSETLRVAAEWLANQFASRVAAASRRGLGDPLC